MVLLVVSRIDTTIDLFVVQLGECTRRSVRRTFDVCPARTRRLRCTHTARSPVDKALSNDMSSAIAATNSEEDCIIDEPSVESTLLHSVSGGSAPLASVRNESAHRSRICAPG